MSAAFFAYLNAGLRSMPITDAKLAASLRATDDIASRPQPNRAAFVYWEVEHASLRLRRAAGLLYAVDLPDLRDGVRAAIESLRGARLYPAEQPYHERWQDELNLEGIWRDYRTAQRAARRERKAA